MKTKLVGMLLLALAGCSKKEATSERQGKIDDALSKVESASYLKTSMKHFAAKEKAGGDVIAEYQVALLDLSTAKLRCEDAGGSYTEIHKAEQEGEKRAEQQIDEMKSKISDY